ncbi:hypothetical protein [Cellulomonas sp. KRMCY2]|uniref:hypothetical protein n=1 Tax=Cellulomonas sp. KRMCY2 TaxID=1304865 RepID=UPI0012DFBA83|nr:hypothetical protein [Cellulomonas sp. KRMCY2]
MKERIYALPEADAESRSLPSEIVLVVDGCAVMTPEGRILLDLLKRLERDGLGDFGVEQRLEALSIASGLRGRWHAKWLRSQFESSVSAPVLGAGVFLLVNGSIGAGNALDMPAHGERDRELGSVVLPLIAQFSKALGGRVPATDSGIRQHWVFTQLSRLLGRDVAREASKVGTAVWVRAGREEDLLSELATRLHRGRDRSRVDVALGDFVDAYRTVRGPLAALGQMHEEPTATRRIVQRLLRPGEAS